MAKSNKNARLGILNAQANMY